MEQCGYHIWIQQRRVYKHKHHPFFYRKEIDADQCNIRSAFRNEFKKIKESKRSGASANAV
jgi:hypothetical protein